MASLFASLGFAASIPPPSIGEFEVSYVFYRFPDGCLAQVFFPTRRRRKSQNAAGQVMTNNKKKRAYVRREVVLGLSQWAKMPSVLFGGLRSPHPLLHAEKPIKLHPEEDRKRDRDLEREREHDHEHDCAREIRKFKVIMFSHGLGGNAQIYTKVCADLSALGFVVIAFEHEDGSGSFAQGENGEMVRYKAPPEHMQYTRENTIAFRKPMLEHRLGEIRSALSHILEFVNDPNVRSSRRSFVSEAKASGLRTLESEVDIAICEELFRQMNTTDMIIAGHSFGGTSTVMASLDPFIRPHVAGIVLYDVWPYPLPREVTSKGVDVPTISILSETFSGFKETTLTEKLIRRAPEGTAISVHVVGTVHQSFSDTPFWLSGWLLGEWISQKLQLSGSLPKDILEKSIVELTKAFLTQVLENKEHIGKGGGERGRVVEAVEEAMNKLNSNSREVIVHHSKATGDTDGKIASSKDTGTNQLTALL